MLKDFTLMELMKTDRLHNCNYLLIMSDTGRLRNRNRSIKGVEASLTHNHWGVIYISTRRTWNIWK